MTPTTRAVFALLAAALVALVISVPIALLLAAIVAILTVADWAFTSERIRVRRTVPRVLARGRSATLTVEAETTTPSDVELRQPQPPDVVVEPAIGTHAALAAQLTAYRRGEHVLPPIAARRTGPFGFGRRTFDGEGTATLLVYPDVVAAQRVVTAIRQGRFRDPGLRTRGPLGLGTDFESIRDYEPDDDIRQINWTATARVGRPMSNVYRIEQDRDVMCLLDSGRLMNAPLNDSLTRLDAAVDATTMVALVADELGDRCGVTVFDNEVRKRLAPRRNGGRAVVSTILDCEPTTFDSDYDLAFRTVSGGKRALIIVLTDLVDEAAARSIVEAMPVLARRHAVVVAYVRDPDLDDAVTRAPSTPHDVYASAVAVDVLEARRRVEAQLRGSGVEVIDARPDLLGETCVRAYLRLKARARL
jgi:uncharacterized protein (DUF58 family)